MLWQCYCVWSARQRQGCAHSCFDLLTLARVFHLDTEQNKKKNRSHVRLRTYRLNLMFTRVQLFRPSKSVISISSWNLIAQSAQDAQKHVDSEHFPLCAKRTGEINRCFLLAYLYGVTLYWYSRRSCVHSVGYTYIQSKGRDWVSTCNNWVVFGSCVCELGSCLTSQVSMVMWPVRTWVWSYDEFTATCKAFS